MPFTLSSPPSPLVENSFNAILTFTSVARCKTTSKVKAFLIISHPEIFYAFNGSVIVGVIARITSYLLSLMGSYRDLLVMCISLALTTRLQQVNKILLLHKGRFMVPSFFAEHRLYHRKLVSLVADADNAISSITMLALSNNLFYICTSLLNSL
jgi:gustatory receptor